jgi:hypothetical protein
MELRPSGTSLSVYHGFAFWEGGLPRGLRFRSSPVRVLRIHLYSRSHLDYASYLRCKGEQSTSGQAILAFLDSRPAYRDPCARRCKSSMYMAEEHNSPPIAKFMYGSIFRRANLATALPKKGTPSVSSLKRFSALLR